MVGTLSEYGYQKIFSVKDKLFNTAALSQYHLALNLYDTVLKVSCVDLSTRQCMFLAVYNLAQNFSPQRIQALEQLYQSEPLLKASSWSSVTLCVGNQDYTLVPKLLLKQENLTDYLAFACPQGLNTVRHFTHSSLPMAVVFGLDPLLLNWFQNTYASTPLYCIHQASCLVEGSLHYVNSYKPSATPQVFVFVEAHHLHIMVPYQNKLLYYNRFPYETSDEFLQYILLVMQVLELDPGTGEIILAGDVVKESITYKKAENYIRKVILCNGPTHLNLSSVLRKEMSVSHFDVLSTFLCQKAM